MLAISKECPEIHAIIIYLVYSNPIIGNAR